MRTAWLIAPALLALGLQATSSQPLYLGPEEVDTADEQAVTAVVEHCAELAADAPDAAAAEAFTAAHPTRAGQPAQASAGVEPPLGMAIALAPEDATSDGDDAEAAGEGAGGGPDTESDSVDASQDDQPDFGAITLQACKEAGLVY